MKEMMNDTFNVIGKKNNQTSISNADREIPTLESMDNAGNSVNLVSGISQVLFLLGQVAAKDRTTLTWIVVKSSVGPQLQL